MRTLLFLTICFSGFWTTGAIAVDSESHKPSTAMISKEPPVTILSAWIGRDRDGDPEPIIKVRANEPILGCDFSYEWFDKAEKVMPSSPSGGGFARMTVIEKDEVYSAGFSSDRKLRHEHLHQEINVAAVVLIKFRLINVLLPDRSQWRPPADHPITFEARWKPEEKAGKTASKEKVVPIEFEAKPKPPEEKAKDATHKAPITILASWIERDNDGNMNLVVRLRTNNQANRGCSYATQWFDQFGEEITDDGKPDYDKSGNPLPVAIPTRPAIMVFSNANFLAGNAVYGQTIRIYEPSRKSSYTLNAKHIVRMKCRLISVHLADGTTWTPPADHPITFEAKLKKAEEKDEAKAKQKQ